MKTRFLSLLCASAIAADSAPPSAYSDVARFVLNFPTWNVTTDELVLAWGQPASIEKGPYFEQWRYPRASAEGEFTFVVSNGSVGGVLFKRIP